MPRLFHPKVGREVTVPAGAAKVLAASGWVPADTPPAPDPEPAPVDDGEPKPRRRQKSD